MFTSRPLSVLFLGALPSVFAGNVAAGGACSPSDDRLDPSSHIFLSDCTDTTFCAASNTSLAGNTTSPASPPNANGTCQVRRCRRDEFPFGYSSNVTIPDKRPRGSFCPDEQDFCQPLLAVGSACQFNRDGESLVAVMCGAVEEIGDRRVVLRMKMNAKDRRTLGNLRTRLGLG